MSSNEHTTHAVDLGRDPIGPLLCRLALPTITAQIVNLLYNIVDRIYIGRIPLEGKLALTGMGVTFPVITLISAFSALVGMGGAPRASIALGAGEKDRAERTLGTCAAALWSLAAVLTVLFLLFQRDLLRLFGASADTLPYAMQYLSIYVLGTVFVMTALGLNGFITAQGSSAVAMKTVVIGAVLNVVLDPLFIFVLHMGVRGAALASDAFFPFDDCVKACAEAGISCIIQPGGSVRDQDSIDACDRYGIAMVFTGMRHFKH